MITLPGKCVQNQIEENIHLSEKSSKNNIFLARVWMFTIHTLAKNYELNVCQINIYQNLILLYKAHTGTAPLLFFIKFSKVNHNYLTSSKNRDNYTIPKSTIKLTNFAISRRAPIFTIIESKNQRNASLA